MTRAMAKQQEKIEQQKQQKSEVKPRLLDELSDREEGGASDVDIMSNA